MYVQNTHTCLYAGTCVWVHMCVHGICVHVHAGMQLCVGGKRSGINTGYISQCLSTLVHEEHSLLDLELTNWLAKRIQRPPVCRPALGLQGMLPCLELLHEFWGVNLCLHMKTLPTEPAPQLLFWSIFNGTQLLWTPRIDQPRKQEHSYLHQVLWSNTLALIIFQKPPPTILFCLCFFGNGIELGNIIRFTKIWKKRKHRQPDCGHSALFGEIKVMRLRVSQGLECHWRLVLVCFSCVQMKGSGVYQTGHCLGKLCIGTSDHAYHHLSELTMYSAPFLPHLHTGKWMHIDKVSSLRQNNRLEADC